MTRANFNVERETTQRYYQLLRAGSVEGERSADHQRRPALRRPGAGRLRPAADRRWTARTLDEFQLKNNWAPRLGLAYDVARRRQVAAVCQLGPLLRPRAQRPRRARVVGGRGHHARRLLRRRPDAADSERHASRRRRPGAPITQHFLLGQQRHRPDRSGREALLQGRVRRRLRVGGAAEHHARHPLHPPQHRPRARGHLAVPGGRLRLRRGRGVRDRLCDHQPQRRHAGDAGAGPAAGQLRRSRRTTTTPSS